MPRVCTVCSHPNYHQIDLWIVSGVSSGEIARRTGLGKSSIRRHRLAGMHLSSPSVRLEQAQEAGRLQREKDIERNRRNRALQKQQQATEPPTPAPAPPPLPPPAPKPEPVNPPNKTFTWEEIQELERMRRQRVREAAWARRYRGLRLPTDPPAGYGGHP
jgi:hypothetical protein